MYNNYCRILVAGAIAMAGLGSANVLADDSGAFAKGHGTSNGLGVTKRFDFSAEQKSAVTLAARGEASLIQIDPTNVFGDFSLSGKVRCVFVAGNFATVGLVIRKASGTAAPHVGEAFYLFARDNAGLGVPDEFDNSGFTGTPVTDCNQVGGFNGVVVKGDIRVGLDDDDDDDED